MIAASRITVTFRRGFARRPLRALDDFSLTVNPGDVFGLLGPNGAGKSTAMYVFLGLIRPDAGTILVAGEEPVPGSPLFRRIAYVPEEPHYHLYMTVGEALDYYARLSGESAARGRVEGALERVGLASFRDLRLDRCSKGMKQKLGIATCLLTRPEIVFLDEPTRGLDPVVVKEFRDIILDMNRQGSTFVINSHVLSEVELVCNRVAILDRGRVVLQDELRRLLRYDTERYAVEFSDPGPGDLPVFVEEAERRADAVHGFVPVTAVQEFFRYAQERQVRVYACALRRLSLEDAFFRVLKGGAE